ncbi:MAG: tRNA (adenosine(37)-N6)-threonylcarbamoyltransferase complex ATPase subunit type 1 TsaE [Desulfobacterales bacterium]
MEINRTTHSPAETQHLGEIIGKAAGGGTILALTGELGSGKTAFVQGLARGLDVPKDYYITSPTYTLINEYPGRHALFHVDLYRIAHIDDFEDIGLYDILSSNGVVAIEWPDKLPADAIPHPIRIHLEIIGEDSRKISFAAYGRKTVTMIQGLENEQ